SKERSVNWEDSTVGSWLPPVCKARVRFGSHRASSRNRRRADRRRAGNFGSRPWFCAAGGRTRGIQRDTYLARSIRVYRLFMFYFPPSGVQDALRISHQLLRIAKDGQDRVAQIEAHFIHAATLVLIGRYKTAEQHLREVFKRCNHEVHHTHATIYFLNPFVRSLSYYGITRTIQGFLNEGIARPIEATQQAEEVNHPPRPASLCPDATVLRTLSTGGTAGSQSVRSSPRPSGTTTWVVSRHRCCRYVWRMGCY